MKKRFYALLLVLCAAFCMTGINTKAAEKPYESYYSTIYMTEKIGKYKIKINDNGMMVRKGKGKYRYVARGDVHQDFLSNGTYIYYSKRIGNRINAYRVKMNGTGTKFICALDKNVEQGEYSEEESWLLGVYRDKLYFASTYGTPEDWDYTWSYSHVYDMKTKRYRFHFSEGLSDLKFYKNRIYFEYQSNDMFSGLGYMKLNGTGKKILVKRNFSYKIIKGKLYYVAKSKGFDVKLYRADMNGKRRKALTKSYESIPDYNDKYAWVWKKDKAVRIRIG